MPTRTHQHTATNRQVHLKSRSAGIPQAEHSEIVETPVADPANRRVVVRNLYLSLESTMCGWVSIVGNCS